MQAAQNGGNVVFVTDSYAVLTRTSTVVLVCISDVRSGAELVCYSSTN